jgi:hypothetical protein
LHWCYYYYYYYYYYHHYSSSSSSSSSSSRCSSSSSSSGNGDNDSIICVKIMVHSCHAWETPPVQYRAIPVTRENLSSDLGGKTKDSSDDRTNRNMGVMREGEKENGT